MGHGGKYCSGMVVPYSLLQCSWTQLSGTGLSAVVQEDVCDKRKANRSVTLLQRLKTFLQRLRATCLAQQQADAEGQVHWSRHLLACLSRITEAELLLGTRRRAVWLAQPALQHFVSPFAGDQWLGAHSTAATRHF